jgi:16S rRNA (cytidine1402-2'-O)-methyltransferase
MTGKLFLVSLPIGNLEDITLRAIQTLRAVDLIVAEDTRTTGRILVRYRIRTPFDRSCYEGVERRRVERTLALLEGGKDLALVSDAGTPLVSDPGFPLVRAAVSRGIPVIPIPGPTAMISALVGSGLPTDRFAFDGAVPRSAGKRRALLESLREERRTVVIYESPHRLLATLEAAAEILPDRRIVLARELTKLHEEFLRGDASTLLKAMREREGVKGECALVIEGAAGGSEGIPDDTAVKDLAGLLVEEGVPKRTVVKVLAHLYGVGRNRAYRLLHDD